MHHLRTTLDRVELGKSVERALLSRELVPLPPAVRFPGAGLYALYYTGDFEPYRAIAPPARKVGDIPIYVGRAAPPGGRAADRATDFTRGDGPYADDAIGLASGMPALARSGPS